MNEKLVEDNKDLASRELTIGILQNMIDMLRDNKIVSYDWHKSCPNLYLSPPRYSEPPKFVDDGYRVLNINFRYFDEVEK
jgi:sRNA-binding protein